MLGTKFVNNRSEGQYIQFHGGLLCSEDNRLFLAINRKRYRGVLVARPVFPMGRDIGYLPGDVGQKLDPWIRSTSVNLLGLT